jgi:hypothetical protein
VNVTSRVYVTPGRSDAPAAGAGFRAASEAGAATSVRTAPPRISFRSTAA